MRRSSIAVVSAATTLMSLVGVAAAQTVTVPVPSSGEVRTSRSPQRDTLRKMMRPVSIEFTGTRLEDAMRYITEVSQADIDVMWLDDRATVGLDKDVEITLKVERVTALTLLEKVLERATGDTTGTGGSTWQLSETGALQVGPKERLNKFRRVELYAMQDLLLETPDFIEAPQFDLQSILQSTQGGGGGQSPFQDTENEPPPRRPFEDRVAELISVITSLVEPEQWVDNGGEGASIRAFQGSLIVNAPDYVHRQLNGYPFWPSSGTRMANRNGRRYVTIGTSSSIGKVDGFVEHPVTAVVGGRLISSDPNRGPGGSTRPAPKPTDTSDAKNPPEKK